MTSISILLLLVSTLSFLSHGHEVKDSFQINIERDSLSDAQISDMESQQEGYKYFTDNYLQDRKGNYYVKCRIQNTTVSNGFISTDDIYEKTKRCILHELEPRKLAACRTTFDATVGKLTSSCESIEWPEKVTKHCDMRETSPNVYSCICATHKCNDNMESEALLLFERYQASNKNDGKVEHHKHLRTRKEIGRSRLHFTHSLH
ncbi:unnamed protein product [Caenorhabditis brenneri]